jgi:hypothetical protein
MRIPSRQSVAIFSSLDFREKQVFSSAMVKLQTPVSEKIIEFCASELFRMEAEGLIACVGTDKQQDSSGESQWLLAPACDSSAYRDFEFGVLQLSAVQKWQLKLFEASALIS